MAHFSIGLVHYPIYNKHGDIITTALTNYDIHDLARSATTYGVENYYIIHPNFAQRKLAEEIMEHWQTGFGSTYNPDRKDAFAHVKLRENLAQVREEIHRETGHPPQIITTDARTYPNTVTYRQVREWLQTTDNSYLLLFGTGYGMTKEAMHSFDYILEPIYGAGAYNHLSVRSAAAIMLDRLCGTEWWQA